MMEDSVKRIVMDALRSSALRGWSVWTSLLLEWGQSVDPVLWGSLETQESAMVCDTRSDFPTFLLLFYFL